MNDIIERTPANPPLSGREIIGQAHTELTNVRVQTGSLTARFAEMDVTQVIASHEHLALMKFARELSEHLARSTALFEAIVSDLTEKVVAGAEVTALTTVEQLDALPDGSLVGVNAGPYDPDRPWPTRYTYYEKQGRERWMLLDPADRDDGENLEPSGLLIHLSTRFGRCAPRIRLLLSGTDR